MTPEERQEVIDTEHLRLLSLFHYISGALTIAFSCFFIIHLLFMLGMSFAIPAGKHGAEAFPFAIFAGVFGLFILMGITLGVLEIFSGRSIARRQARTMSMVIAAPGVLMMPFGTILSVMTWIVLSRNSVKAMYGEAGAAAGP
jgi:hypothetical protein